MRRTLLLSILLFNVLLARPALPADTTDGKKLHDANCVRCHNTGIYTRRDRHIKSLSGLNEQLNACSHSAEVALTDDEQKSIVKYLNEQFYKFK